MQTSIKETSNWKAYQIFGFRLAFIYFFLQVVPLDWKYYKHLISIDWLHLSFRDLFNISKYSPQFISGHFHADDWGLSTFGDWGLIFAIAIFGTILWSLADKKTQNYNKLYYSLRVLIRYRLAVAVISYGFLKLFAIQAPFPSLSSLNTPYGDFSSWKIFSLSLGIVPGYQSFLGAVELIAGLLLLNRKTTVIGATIIIFFTGNVFMSNLAYEGGEVVYSFYLVTLALFLVLYDLERIINLIILHKPAIPALKPFFNLSKQHKTIRIALKAALIFVFVFFNGYSVYRSALNGGYHFPHQAGLKSVQGLYTVTNFKLNGQTLPYSLTDPVRWQNVVFEKWASLSIKVNSSYVLVNHPVENIPEKEDDGTFQQDGTVGRKYYVYHADTIKKVLLLEPTTTNKKASTIHYTLNADSTIVLTGVIDGDQVEAVLKKDPKKYLLRATSSGRRKSLKL
jgi:hypothetical protein